MPVQTESSGLYDFQIQVVGEGRLTRLASLNHPVKVSLAPDETYAKVALKDCVDRTLVPCRDFVLYVRDEGISNLSAMSSQTISGRQAVSLKVMPDFRAEGVKERVAQDLARNRASAASPVDISNKNIYRRNEAEKQA